jgi:hypothetical protein
MRQKLLGIAALVALATSLHWFESQSFAQEAEAQASGAAQSEQKADDATTDSKSQESQTQQSNDQAGGQTSTQSDASAEQPSASASAQTEASADAAVDHGDQPTDTGSTALPKPDPDSQQQTSEGSDRPDSNQTLDRDATQNPDRDARARTDAGFRGRADVRGEMRDDRRRDRELGIRFGAANRRGLTIDTIERNSIFYDSGLRGGDVIISVSGRPLRTEVDFVAWVHRHPGQRIPVMVLRDGRQETVYITYEQDMLPPESTTGYSEPQAIGAQAYLGVMFDAQVFDAALVRSVAPDSPAAHAGLRSGDMIVALNEQPVSSYRDAIDVISTMRPGDQLAIRFSRRVEDQTQAVLGGRPGSMRTATRPAEVGIERDDAPPPAYEQRPIDANPSEVDRRPQRLNRDGAPERPIRDRPLLPRLRN